MSRVGLIAARELSGLFRSASAYWVAGLVLFVDGLLFNAFAIGAEPKPSAAVLEDFFHVASGTTMVASIFVGMRPLVEERATGSLVLLTGSPARAYEIVLGKFLACWVYVLVLTACTLYMPALVLTHGRVSLGHVLTGYVGLGALSATAISLGLVGSSWARSQLVAGLIGAALLVTLLLGWLLARLSEPPVSELLAYAALFQAHFLPLQRGVLRLSDVVYLLSVAGVALMAASLTLGGERWE